MGKYEALLVFSGEYERGGGGVNPAPPPPKENIKNLCLELTTQYYCPIIYSICEDSDQIFILK